MVIAASTRCITARKSEGQQSSCKHRPPSARTWSLAAILASVKTLGASTDVQAGISLIYKLHKCPWMWNRYSEKLAMHIVLC